mmetsp:Transcript_4548/g.9917  ORF Transcript_4548/g.9917 Transcript_4548/m.9917 type:complete len:459 (-) Transcript_4548:198-1574(-)
MCYKDVDWGVLPGDVWQRVTDFLGPVEDPADLYTGVPVHKAKISKVGDFRYVARGLRLHAAHIREIDCSSEMTLSLENCQLISSVFQLKPSMQVLRLPRTIKDPVSIAPGLSTLCDAVAKSNLCVLDLTGHNFGPKGTCFIANLLMETFTLQELNLNDCGLGPQDGKRLADAVANNKSLLKLDLSSNYDLFIEGSAPMARALIANTTLQTLALGGNRLSYDGIKCIAEALKHNTSLHHLDLHWVNLGPQGARAIASVLSFNNSLEQLQLGGNEIGPEGVVFIAEALQLNQGLLTLDLSRNRLGAQGISAIGDGLSHNTTLRALNLKVNNLKPDSAYAITHLLGSCTHLHKLDLSWNLFGPQGGKAIGEGLAVNHSLQELILTTCDLKYGGGLPIVEGLNANSTLKVLDVTTNNMDYKSVTLLAQTFHAHRSLHTLLVSEGNFIRQEDIALIQTKATCC